MIFAGPHPTIPDLNININNLEISRCPEHHSKAAALASLAAQTKIS